MITSMFMSVKVRSRKCINRNSVEDTNLSQEKLKKGAGPATVTTDNI
jgi:hypothetical protein